MAFLAAVAFVGYMFAGNNMRTGGAVILGIACEFMENYHSRSWKIGGPFAWTRRGFWAPTLYLAIGPGLVGHTGLNFVVKYTGPLIISMAITLEPVIGSLIGWAIHVSSTPGVFTCVGGALLVIGTLVVNYFNGKAKKKKEGARQQQEHTQDETQNQSDQIDNSDATTPAAPSSQQHNPDSNQAQETRQQEQELALNIV